MLKTLQRLFKQMKERYVVPRRVQDIIPIRRIWKDGIFLVGNCYTKTYQFTDINYLVASKADQDRMFKAYARIINSFDSTAITKLTISNHRINQQDFEDEVLMKEQGDGCDGYRQDYNSLIDAATSGSSGFLQEKYITVSVCKKSIDEARVFFQRVESDLGSSFLALGSKFSGLDTMQRLKMLHNFYRAGEERFFHLDLQDMMRKGHSFKDYICPDAIERNRDYLRIGDKYCRVLYLKDYASVITDRFVTDLTSLNRSMMMSIDMIMIPKAEAVREAENCLLSAEKNIADHQRRQNNNLNFNAIIPYDLQEQRNETFAFLDDLRTKDQNMLMGVITMVHMADTKEQLDADTEAIVSTALNQNCQMVTLKYQQMDGLNTVLPIGALKIKALRTFNTESLAIFIPFKVQEIIEKGGIYFGENAISHNLILCNQSTLLNQSSIIFGIPGSGKSFFTKMLIFLLAMQTQDDILVCDPEGEYAPLVEALGDEGSIVRISAGGRDRLNAMYMADGYGERETDPVVEKSQFIMSLIERFSDSKITAAHKSVIDRCIKQIYTEMRDTKEVPTLCTLREKLMEQPEEEAHEVALALELYTTGSLDIFGRESNVDLNKRVTVFDIHGLGEHIKPAGLLVITETMINRVTENWKRGKRTHIFIDEFHVVYSNEHSAEFFNSAWRQFRKRNAYPTAITQNVEYLLHSAQGSTMLSNSELIVMFNQAERDQEQLAELLNISKEQMGYVTDTEAGSGLIKYGRALVPFVNRFPRNTKLYELMTTKPGEGVFSKGQA